LKVVTADEMRDLDQKSIREFGIASSLLMERAGVSVVLAMENSLTNMERMSFVVLCGGGNNGGDGLVVARELLEYTDEVTTVLVAGEEKFSQDARVNLRRLRSVGGTIRVLGKDIDMNELARVVRKSDVVVDALLGTGIKGDVKDEIGKVIQIVNLYAKYVVSVDLPSGLDTDTGKPQGIAIKADMTVTFAFPKMCHVLFPGRELTGKLKVAHIGIPRSLKQMTNIKREIVTEAYVRAHMPPRHKNSHKGDYGKLVVVGGSKNYMGAPILTCLGALRAGVGYVQLVTPRPINLAAISVEPSIVCAGVDTEDGYFKAEHAEQVCKIIETADVVAIGPGLSWNGDTTEFVRQVLVKSDKPFVIDADALNCISSDIEILKNLSSKAILTPHPGELARLTKKNISEVIYNYRLAEKLAFEYNLIVLLKGASSIIASPRSTYINLTGNTSLSKAGSGDILTGIIGAFIAQGMDLESSCVCAAYIHGLTGERFENWEGSALATDLINKIPVVIEEVAE